MPMRKKLNRFYISYILIGGLAVVILAVIEMSSLKMDKDFSKDLRVDLPDYTLQNTITSDVSEENGELIHMVKEYYIQLDEPMPEKSLRILAKQNRGWYLNEQGDYYLERSKGGEDLFCTFDSDTNSIYIKYHYAYLLSGAPVFAFLLLIALGALFLIIWFILEVTVGRRA
jgi:hypothetical protein